MSNFLKDLSDHVRSQKDPADGAQAQPRISQTRLFSRFIKFSVVGHILVFCFSFLSTPHFFSSNKVDEWVIDTDLVIDQPGSLAQQESAMPRAKESEKDAVPRNLLPQLPKNVAVKKSIEELPTQGAEEKKSDESNKESTKENAEKTVAKEESQDKGASGGPDNLMREEELLRRKAIEDLKKQKKFSDKYEAQKKDALARLRSEVGAVSGQLSGGTGSGPGATENEYRHLIQQSIQKCYTLNNYYSSDQKLTAIVFLKLTGSGEILEANVQETSHDAQYDADIIKAIYNCAPFAPPPEQKNWESRLQFNISD